MAKKKEFKQQKVNYKVRGIITRLNDRGYKEDDNGMWHRLRFGVKTSKTNEVPVELFGYMGDAYYWSKKEGKTFKRDYDNRYDKPKGVDDAHLIGVQINTTGKKDGVKNLHAYDAVTALLEEFADGDSVQISGSIDYSTYEKEGKTVVQSSYSIGRITKFSDPIDFEHKSFKEVSAFDATLMFMDVSKAEGEEDKHFEVASRIITKKDGTYVDTEFQLPESKTKMYKAFKKNLKWGDEIKVKGYIRNEAIEAEVEVEEEDEWGSEDVAGYGKPIVEYKRSLDIVQFDQDYWKEGDKENGVVKGKGKFTEEDFEVDEFNEADAADFDDDDDDWA